MIKNYAQKIQITIFNLQSFMGKFTAHLGKVKLTSLNLKKMWTFCAAA